MRLQYATLASFIAGGAAFGFATGTGMAPNPFGDDSSRNSATIEQQESAVAAQAEALAALEERSSELSAMTAEIDSRRADLDKKDSELQQFASLISEREAELEKSGTDLSERDASLQELRSLLNERQSELEEREAELAGKEEQLTALQVALEELKIAPGNAEAIAALQSVSIGDPEKIEPAPGEPRTELIALPRPAARISKPQMTAGLMSVAPDGITEASLSNAQSLGDAPLAEVHFESNSASLTPGGLARARAAAEKVAQLDVTKIRIAGHTDTTGSPLRNAALSKARAEAVADIFVQSGLAREMIEVIGLGETPDMLPIATADGTSEPLNRCVGIFAIPG